MSNEETQSFKLTFNANDINVYKPANLYDLCIAINSCKLFIGNLSSPLAFAYALHKTSIVGLCNGIDQNHHLGLDKVITNLIINVNTNAVIEQIKLICD